MNFSNVFLGVAFTTIVTTSRQFLQLQDQKAEAPFISTFFETDWRYNDSFPPLNFSSSIKTINNQFLFDFVQFFQHNENLTFFDTKFHILFINAKNLV